MFPPDASLLRLVGVAVLCVAACTSSLPASHSGGDESGACDGGVDDDGDGLVDCADPDCADDVACQSATAADAFDDTGADGLRSQSHDVAERVDGVGPRGVDGGARADGTAGPTSDGTSGLSDVALPDGCLTESEYFSCAVWDPFMGSTCLTCHQPGGIGASQSAFELVPGDIDASLERVRAMAQHLEGGVPVLLLKAQGELSHGGGTILPEGSAEYDNLVALLAYFDDPAYCRPTCDGHVELIVEPEEVCEAPPVTDSLDASQETAAPPIYTQRLTHWQYRSSVNRVFNTYIDSSMTEADAQAVFEAMTGTSANQGSNTERIFSLFESALSSSNRGTGGCNEGFYREDAKLNLVAISDEPEQSAQDYTYFVSLFQSMKSDSDDLVMHAVAADNPSNGGANTCGASYDPRYENASTDTGGLYLSICATDWGSHLETLAENSTADLSSFELTDIPVPETIEVQVDGITTIQGWSYNPVDNSVDFETDYVPEGGSTINVDYALMGDCEQ